MNKTNLNRFEKLRQYVSEIEGRILSAREFSRILGLSPTLIGMIERGNTPPSKKVAARLEEKYEISREWYLTGEGEAPWGKEVSFEFNHLLKREREIGGVGLEIMELVIEAWKEPKFRPYIYGILNEMLERKCATVFLECESKPSPFHKAMTPEPGEPKKAPGELIYKSLEFALDIPTMLNGLSSKERKRWTRNVGVLERWVILMPRKALMVPPWAYIRFCREVELDHGSGKLDKVTDVLRNIIKEGKK